MDAAYDSTSFLAALRAVHMKEISLLVAEVLPFYAIIFPEEKDLTSETTDFLVII